MNSLLIQVPSSWECKHRKACDARPRSLHPGLATSSVTCSSAPEVLTQRHRVRPPITSADQTSRLALASSSHQISLFSFVPRSAHRVFSSQENYHTHARRLAVGLRDANPPASCSTETDQSQSGPPPFQKTHPPDTLCTVAHTTKHHTKIRRRKKTILTTETPSDLFSPNEKLTRNHDPSVITPKRRRGVFLSRNEKPHPSSYNQESSSRSR